MEVHVERLHRVKPLALVAFFEETVRRERRKEAAEGRKPLRGTESDAYEVEISAAGRRAAAGRETGGMMVEGF